MPIMRDYICRSCGNKQEEFETEFKTTPCTKCGKLELNVDPVPKCCFIDKTREYNWTQGKTVAQQAAVLAGNAKPY